MISLAASDVGLEGNAINHADDVGDFGAALVYLLHGADHLLHHFAALGGGAGRIGGQLAGLACGVGALAHGGRQFFHAGGGLLQAAGGLLGAGAQVLVAVGNVTTGIVQLRNAVAHRADQRMKALLHIAHCCHHAGGVARLGADGNGQVALLHGLHYGAHFTGFSAQLAANAARDHGGGGHAYQHGQQCDDQHHAAELFGLVVGCGVVGDDAFFFKVDQLVDGGQPLLVLGLGLGPEQCLGACAVACLHQRQHFLRGVHGARFDLLNGLDHRSHLCRNGTGGAQGLLHLFAGLGIKIGQPDNGLHLFVAQLRGGRQYGIAHGNGAVVRRAPEVDGRALDHSVLRGVGAQGCVNPLGDIDAEDGHPQQNGDDQAKAGHQAVADFPCVHK